VIHPLSQRGRWPRRARHVGAGLALALAAAAQPAPVAAQDAAVAPAALLRTLDRRNGAVEDVLVEAGKTVRLGRLAITLSECRFPAANPAGDAFAHLVIADTEAETEAAPPVFSGWMVASSPALNPLDHPRYDVWVLRCARPG
jgi:hypothetical protein